MKKHMVYTVYVLESMTYNSRYIGYTQDIEKRVREHNKGLSTYTSGRRPWKLIYTEDFDNRTEAMRREKFLKSGKGRDFLDSIKC